MESRVGKDPTEGQGMPTEEQLDQITTTLQRAREMAIEQAKAADRVVRQYPYQAIGVALGLGLLIGILARRR